MDAQLKCYQESYLLEKFSLIKTSGSKYALIQINIKNFLYFNTKYGVKGGNEILVLVLQELKSFFNIDEYTGYLYSDNFAVLAKYEDMDHLLHNRLVPLIDKLYRINDPRIFRNLFFSMGAYQIDDMNLSFYDAWNYANLSRKETVNLHQRVSSIEVYGQPFYNRYMNHMELEIKTADAYKNYEFVAWLQPKIDLKNEKIIGAEALLRWFDKDGNSIPLDKFLPILNENHYIVLVDLDIFDQMCKYLDERIKNRQKIVPISFNISHAYFYDPNILKDYINIFEQYDIPKEYIELEFMESISLNDTARMKKVISGFKDYGFTCVLDDFGNGYSSFNVLLNAPLDIIKMDRQFFLENLKGDGKLVIKTMIDLIHSLKMKVVAEGVEQAEHIEYLKICQCDFVQGYYYYKPMSVHEFGALLTAES